ncbi:MAG TPA: hypothetical protein EYP86_00980 [Candidatus Altiarchaeales archaeon]|nr:hypothetical protein [Candidatus Altiarchaeales archaeon]
MINFPVVIMKTDKGQISLEFMLTYGWVVLIIILATVVVWQMSLFNLGGEIRPGYSGFWGLIPTAGDFKFSSGELTFPITNEIGRSVNITSVSVKFQGVTRSQTGNWYMPAGSSETFTISGFDAISPGSRFDMFVIINYTDTSLNEDFVCSGWIWGNSE